MRFVKKPGRKMDRAFRITSCVLRSIIFNRQKRLSKHLRIAMKKPTDVTTGRFLPYAFDEAFADLSVLPILPAYNAFEPFSKAR